jgi:hypothetical protein
MPSAALLRHRLLHPLCCTDIPGLLHEIRRCVCA